MADGTIFDQTLDTAQPAAGARFLKQVTSAATASTATTFALMGGLEVSNQTVTTADITGAVGKLYVCTITGLTANRNLTLPSAQVGERVGVYIVDGDATYTLICKGAASQTINGGSAATEWSRLFIANECVIFRCIAANTWIVEYDGRIPVQAKVYISTADTSNPSAAHLVDLSAYTTTSYDNASIVDTTNDVFKIRRSSKYRLHAGGRPSTTLASSNETFGAQIVIKTGAILIAYDLRSSTTTTNRPLAVAATVRSLSTGDEIEWYYIAPSGKGIDALQSVSQFIVQEVF